jgi:hypothetical protein
MTNRALEIYGRFRLVGLQRIEAFPDLSGEVMVSAVDDDYAVEITCQMNGLYTILLEHGDVRLFDHADCSLMEVTKILENFEWPSKKSSGSFIHFSSATNVVDLRASPLKRLATELRSSVPNVQLPPAERFAHTFNDSTNRERQEIRRFS